jgi:transcriptional regulator with XRE-family HTH domain
MKNLGLNLKNLLHNEMISENELARRTGVSQQIINRILSGENTNPKIATLSPLANYFMITISQLIGEELSSSEKKTHINQSDLQKIPLIEWSNLETLTTSNSVLITASNKLLIDLQPTESMFAVKMQGNSMEPKFSNDTLLILDLNKMPVNGDFVLLSSSGEVTLRQFFFKQSLSYKKCLNPKYKDYKLSIINKDSKYLGTLIQSRTNYITS